MVTNGLQWQTPVPMVTNGLQWQTSVPMASNGKPVTNSLQWAMATIGKISIPIITDDPSPHLKSDLNFQQVVDTLRMMR